MPSTQFFTRLPTFADGLGIALFCGVGLFISTLAEARLRAQSRVEAQVLEVQQAQARERDARAEAEHANKAKDEFLAILAHELRQPLGAARRPPNAASASSSGSPVMFNVWSRTGRPGAPLFAVYPRR